MSKTYTPKPGSVPARAIEHLHDMGPGSKLLTGDLARQIGVECHNLLPCIEKAIESGLLVLERVSPRRAFVCLPNGDPADVPQHKLVSAAQAPRPATMAAPSVFAMGDSLRPSMPPPNGAAEVAAPPNAASGFKRWLEGKGETSAEGAHWRKQAKPKADHKSKAPLAKPAAKAKPGPRKAAAPAPATAITSVTPAPASPSVEVALFNSGSLHIEVPDQPPLRLSRTQARELVTYLERISTAIKETA
jgi:hypothetical protein